jgi:septum formation protein
MHAAGADGAARRLVLASASPARLRLLRDAGLDPSVVVSGLDESTVDESDPVRLVSALAAAKARMVAGDSGLARALVLGCDSMLDLEGDVLGKPGTAEAAIERWRQMRGRTGVLLTGHALIDTATGREAHGVGRTSVRFGMPTDAEIAAYVATGEPLEVAGGFTLDGRAAPFIEGIDGDASNVVGLSLPLLRTLLAQLDIGIIQLWR